MIFRDAVINDLPLIVEIYNSTIEGRMVTADTEPVKVEDKLEWFHRHNAATRPLWIVENKNNEVVGWASFQDFYGRPAYQGTAEISIYLHEHERGKQYGKKILQHAVIECPNLGIHTLLGFIFAHNSNSLQLFIKMGFQEWAHLKDIAILDGKERSLKILGKKIAGSNNLTEKIL